MTLTWIVGSGGLLGNALTTELSQDKDVNLFKLTNPITWSDTALASREMINAISKFSTETKGRNWQIYWAAGISTMHSQEDALQKENVLLETLVTSLIKDPNINLKLGTFIFASSAGAIYSGNTDKVISESTLEKPINPYGKNKLLQEKIVRMLNQNGLGATVLLCRISNLYGFRQKVDKQQGLLTEIARKILLKKVIHIYVPLETMRDYISVNYAAKLILTTVNQIKNSCKINLKIVAAETSTSIAQILNIYKKISRRNVLIVIRKDLRSTTYKRTISFQSENFSDKKSSHNLVEGMAKLLANIEHDFKKNGYSYK